MRVPWTLLAWGLLHTALYASLLPLWEGWDEPFHYSYVQEVRVRGSVPSLRDSSLSEETWRSMHLTPVSYLVARPIPSLMTYSQYFEKTSSERAQMRRALWHLPVELQGQYTGHQNYEAQQPPLAYLLAALVDAVCAGWPLPLRVWLLRLVFGGLSITAFVLVTWKLGERLEIDIPYRSAALFFLLATQMVYASVVHVANEWLSLPLIPLLFLTADTFRRRPTTRGALWFAAVLSAGLLAKAYFLVFVPLAVLFALWVSRRHCAVALLVVALAAGPWYVRNWILYHHLTGIQPAVAAVPMEAVGRLVRSTWWPSALLDAGRAALWTANNTFATFSAATLDCLLALLAAGIALFLRDCHKRGTSTTEWIVLGGSLLYLPVPLYAIMVFGALEGKAQPNATAWYSVGLLPGMFLITMSGCARAGRWGRWFATLLVALCTYVVAATYFVKLIPLYAGYGAQGRASSLAVLYLQHAGDLMERLGQTALAGAWAVIALSGAVVLMGVFLGVQLTRRLD
jgi:hypothetical protein